jgi:hypothetical protein
MKLWLLSYPVNKLNEWNVQVVIFHKCVTSATDNDFTLMFDGLCDQTFCPILSKHFAQFCPNILPNFAQTSPKMESY